MKAEIISIGDELLVGQVINTNASWMAARLNLAGIEVVRIVAIPDQKGEIMMSLKEASVRADVVLITGGLGPTRDDITKNTLCEYFGSKLILHEPSLQYVKKIFHDRGLHLRAINRRQAEIPDNCTPIINNKGTAPGMWFEKDGVVFISLPGVPFEMKAMISDYVIPELSGRLNGIHIVHKMVLTQGVGESFLSETIKEWEDDLPAHIKLAYLPQPGIVRLRLSGRGEKMNDLAAEIDQHINGLRALIPDQIFGYGEETLEEVTGRLLKAKSLRLATAESCTGGYIAHLITSIPGSSDYFTGSVIAYSNQVKMDSLGVQEESLIQHGAVSEQTVREMADGVRKKYNTDYAIAVSGVAGPEGGTQEKPVGTTWIAIAGPEKTLSKKFQFVKNRQRNIRIAALTALNMLRLMLIKS
ncbi:MAG: competence/damage-inducible protein A [Bacteroidota bacterium]